MSLHLHRQQRTSAALSGNVIRAACNPAGLNKTTVAHPYMLMFYVSILVLLVSYSRLVDMVITATPVPQLQHC